MSVGRAVGEPVRDEEAVAVVGVEVAKSGKPPLPAAEFPLDDAGFADFGVAGTPASGECPMCSGTFWEVRALRAPRLAD
jgi:hypothetical protein